VSLYEVKYIICIPERLSIKRSDMQEIGNDGLAEMTKEQVLRNACGRCLCEYTAHGHSLPCGNPLGMNYYWYYIDPRVRILSEKTVMVVCSKCHSKISSSERRPA